MYNEECKDIGPTFSTRVRRIANLLGLFSTARIQRAVRHCGASVNDCLQRIMEATRGLSEMYWISFNRRATDSH